MEERGSEEKGKADLGRLRGGVPTRGVNKAEFGSPPKFYFRCLKVTCADCEGLEIARWLHGNALLKYRNYTTNI
jgi:hypothetical protein